jgi:urease accessory protein
VIRVTAILRSHDIAQERIIDRVILDADEQRRRRIVLTGEKGTTFLLDLSQPVTLRDGDGLVLDDGSIVLVAGKPEPLAEIAAPTPIDFVRLAWHLGNRHAEVQVVGGKVRIRRDHVLEEMARGLGATVTPVEAAFDPAPSEAHEHTHAHGGHDHGDAHHDGHDHAG